MESMAGFKNQNATYTIANKAHRYCAWRQNNLILAISQRQSQSKLLKGFLGSDRQRQGHDSNTLFQQLHGLVRRGLPPNGAFLDLAVVHQSGFLCKARTDILGIGNHLAGKRQPSSLQGGRENTSTIDGTTADGRGVGSGRRRRCSHRLTGTEVQARCAQPLFYVLVCTKRALDKPTLPLTLKIVFGPEPALKDMALPTLEVQNLHDNNIVGLRNQPWRRSR